MEYAKNLRQRGYDDWRLPNISEFGNMVTLCGGEWVLWDDKDSNEKMYRNRENTTYQESYKKLGFASSFYWSADTYGSSHALRVYFGYGRQSHTSKTESHFVRCVR